MLETQMKLMAAWYAAGETVRARLAEARHDERGEVTAQTAMIVLLVAAAIAAAGIIAVKMTNNANNVPEP